MKKQIQYIFIIFASIFFLTSCSENKVTEKNTQASPIISESFSLISNQGKVTPFNKTDISEESLLSSDDQFTLVIQKRALDKEFLLSASAIAQNGSPTSQGLNGKIVVFKKKNSTVYLLEANQGHVITDDLPAQFILAEIPIIKETENTLVIDFNIGMKKIFSYANWYASDFESKEYSTDDQTEAIEVTHSFINSIQLKSKFLEIRQIAQIKQSKATGGDSYYPTYEVRYFIAPYTPNLEFKSKEQPNFNKLGFFELPPYYEKGSGRSIVNITRFDDSKPIPFFYSANTPTEYQAAVKEGILYWNKAFGKDVITADIAPAGVTAPDPEYNLVQWVPYDQAGFAYADALMDPRTGETLHGQAYLTSAFSFGSKVRTRRLLRLLQESKNKEKGMLQISFLGSSKLCNFHAESSFNSLLENAIEKNLSDEILLRMAQDYVRQVTAHEVGHILGLRHNFAGNLGGNLLPTERDQVFNEYVLEKKLPLISEKRPTSSVMEYLGYADDVIAGAQIKNDKNAYDYDKNALAWGYSHKETPKDMPLFCTDSGKLKDKFLDCNTFDSGPEPLSHYVDVFKTALKNQPVSLIEKMISIKAPVNPELAQPIEELKLDPKKDAVELIKASYVPSLPWMNASSRLLSAERSFNFATSLNEKEVQKIKWDNVTKQFDTLGSFEDVLFILDAKKSESLQKDLNERLGKYLEQESVKNFIGHDGKAHTWSEEEIAYINSVAPAYFKIFEETLHSEFLSKLSSAKFDLEFTATDVLEDSSLSTKIEKKLFDTASEYLLKQDESETLKGSVKIGDHEPTVLVKKYFFTQEIRSNAIEILAQKIGPVKDWSLSSRKKLSGSFKSQLESQLGKSLDETKAEDISRPLRQWFYEQKELLDSI